MTKSGGTLRSALGTEAAAAENGEDVAAEGPNGEAKVPPLPPPPKAPPPEKGLGCPKADAELLGAGAPKTELVEG